MKRLETGMHSRLGNDMLGALLHITLNGPDVKEADQLIKATVNRAVMSSRQLVIIASYSDKNCHYFTHEMTLKVLIPNKSDQQIHILDRK